MFKMMVGLITSKEIVLPEEEMLRYNRRFMLFSSLNDMIYYDYERYLEYSKFVFKCLYFGLGSFKVKQNFLKKKIFMEILETDSLSLVSLNKKQNFLISPSKKFFFGFYGGLV